jgi:hypothetical protein
VGVHGGQLMGTLSPMQCKCILIERSLTQVLCVPIVRMLLLLLLVMPPEECLSLSMQEDVMGMAGLNGTMSSAGAGGAGAGGAAAVIAIHY